MARRPVRMIWASAGLRPQPPLVDVHRPQGRDRVEDGVDGAHQRGEEPAQHQPAQARRQQQVDQGRVGQVRVRQRSVAQDHRQGDRRHGGDGRGHVLQHAAGHQPQLGVAHRARSQRALQDDLVGPPVVDVQQQHGPDGRPRQLGVVGRQVQVHQPALLQGRPAAGLPHRQHRQHGTAADQQRQLDGIGAHHRRQPAQPGVGRREGPQRGHHDHDPHRRIRMDERDLLREQGVDRVRPPEQGRAQVEEAVQHHRQHRVGGGHLGAELQLEELGDGDHPLLQVQGHEDERRQQQPEHRVDLQVGLGQAVQVGAAGDAQEMPGVDVGGDGREGDGRPTQAATGNEVLFGGGVGPGARGDADGHDHDEVGGDDDQVEQGFTSGWTDAGRAA